MRAANSCAAPVVPSALKKPSMEPMKLINRMHSACTPHGSRPAAARQPRGTCRPAQKPSIEPMKLLA